MADKEIKKKMINTYKGRPAVGGVFVIKNTQNGKIYLDSTADMHGMENRFNFSQQTRSSFNLKLKKDWDIFGGESFKFVTLETITKAEAQTAQEFADDIKCLKELWTEKLSCESFY